MDKSQIPFRNKDLRRLKPCAWRAWFALHGSSTTRPDPHRPVEKWPLARKFSTALLAIQPRPICASACGNGDNSPVPGWLPQSMPTTLCIWIDSFHCGCAMQYAMAARVFCFCRIESMGWRKKWSKARSEKRSGKAKGCG